MNRFYVKLVCPVVLLCVSLTAIGQVKTVRVILPQEAGAVMTNAGRMLATQISGRAEVKIVKDSSAQLTIELLQEPGNTPESYKIANKHPSHITITGTDEAGVLYGVGKFLRTARYDKKGFTPGTWRGSDAPKGTMRGMYFATHFGNFYEAAPIEEVQRYIEELALWGVNHLVITFPNWQFTSFYDEEAQKLLTRFRKILGAAKLCGMKVGIIGLPNQGFKYTRADFLNTPVPDQLGRRGHFGVNLDPSNKYANKLLKENWAYLMDQFKDVGLDMVIFWPYDEGGCGCDQCWPWGAKGFPETAKELTTLIKERFPDIKIVLSTWMYDTPYAAEWEGLTQFLRKDNHWVDYIMADSHEDFPTYPLEKGVPGSLPLLNFPEISMWGQGPWGGYGANPLVNRFQRLWHQTNSKVSGGFPYSEGIYEDLNKIICTQFYWDGNRQASNIVKEYIAYEYSPDVVNELSEVMEILEANHHRRSIKPSAARAFQLVKQAESKLTPQVLKSWRWRILYLRALIDYEMQQRGGKREGEVLKAAFIELTDIYHAQNSHSMSIRPPVIE